MLRRSLLYYNYFESTIDTYNTAKFIMEGKFNEAKGLLHTKDVNREQVDLMIQLSKDVGITFVALSYPNVGQFNEFYFKEKSESISKLIHKVYDVTDKEIEYQSIQERLEMCHYIKMTSSLDEDLYDEVIDEIELLEKVDGFINTAETISNNLDMTMCQHREAMKIELNRAKRSMYADDFYKLSDERSKKFEAMCKNFEINASLLSRIYEN